MILRIAALLLVEASLIACTGGSASKAPPGESASPRPTQGSQGTPAAVTVAPTASQETDGEPLDLIVTETGYTYFGGDTNWIQYAAIIKNPNPDRWVGRFVHATLTLYDKAGDVIGTADERISNALPGQPVALGGTIFDAKGVTNFEVLLDWDWEEIDYDVGAFTAERIKLGGDEYGTKVTGILKCDFDEDPELVEVVAVFKNSKGKIIGGESSYVDKVRCSAGSPFEINTLRQMKGAKTVEVYAAL